MKVCQKLSALNDRNGNPRRLWVVYEVSKKGRTYPVAVIDEGYRGRPDACRVPELSTIDIAQSTYTDWVRFAKTEGIWQPS